MKVLQVITRNLVEAYGAFLEVNVEQLVLQVQRAQQGATGPAGTSGTSFNTYAFSTNIVNGDTGNDFAGQNVPFNDSAASYPDALLSNILFNSILVSKDKKY